MIGIDLAEDVIHDPGGEQDFAIGDGRVRLCLDGLVEGLDQALHSRLELEVVVQEISEVLAEVPEALTRGQGQTALTEK